jgi:ABC-type sugar transport system substrate-binding protein
MKHLNKTALLLAVSLTALLAAGCSTEFSEKICHYCGGHIAWTQKNTGGFSTTWQQEYEEHDGKYYHKWCYKIAHNH